MSGGTLVPVSTESGILAGLTRLWNRVSSWAQALRS